MKRDNPWAVGITHMVKPPFEPELEAFSGGARFVHFDGRDESGLDQERLADLDALLIWTPPLTHRSIAALSKCRIVVRYGVGYDKIDVAGLREAGIAFANNPEYGPGDVADTAMAMLLSLRRRVLEHDTKARAYAASWQENILSPTLQACDCTVGIVGVGRIGISVVNRLKAFGHRIVGYDPYVPTSHERAIGYERVSSLDALFSQSNVVTLHCPLTSETRAMVDGKLIDAMPAGAILINTARGGLIESLDVVEAALRSGQLGAAGFDCLPQEPPAPHPLIEAWRRREAWLEGRLIITPHTAFFSDRGWWDARFQAAKTARLFLEEQVLRNEITLS
jgi:D-3-phosphoglycerate dehydrogenase